VSPQIAAIGRRGLRESGSAPDPHPEKVMERIDRARMVSRWWASGGDPCLYGRSASNSAALGDAGLT